MSERVHLPGTPEDVKGPADYNSVGDPNLQRQHLTTWFEDLDRAVIDADRCVQCGACVAACPTDSIGVGEDGLPALVKLCIGCGR